MIEKIKNIVEKKSFHICILIIIIISILFILGITILKYNVEGETNMPFELKKISIISSSEGIDKENLDNKWAFDINQNNDIYLYIEKNKNYDKTEIINSVVLDNFNIQKGKDIGITNIYKPDNLEEKQIFKNKNENKVDTIKYLGDITSDIKNLKMSNQGDIISFRISNDKVAEYLSNDDIEINHNELLKKTNIQNEDLKIKLTFDLKIKLQSGKEFKANILIDEMPVGDFVTQGTTSKEYTDLNKIVFKRIKN